MLGNSSLITSPEHSELCNLGNTSLSNLLSYSSKESLLQFFLVNTIATLHERTNENNLVTYILHTAMILKYISICSNQKLLIRKNPSRDPVSFGNPEPTFTHSSRLSLKKFSESGSYFSGNVFELK